RKHSFRLAQFLVPFFESITEQVIPEDLLDVHSEIEGSNDMSSEFDPFLAPTYESKDSADDIEVNEQGEEINVVFGPVNVPSLVNMRLFDENMSLTTTLPASRGGNSLSLVDNIFTSVHAECDMQDMREDVPVKKRSKTIEQATPISIDEAGDGPVMKSQITNKQRDIQAIKVGLPNKTCLRRRPGHVSLDVTLEVTFNMSIVMSQKLPVVGRRKSIVNGIFGESKMQKGELRRG
ncbi:hypothetical protein IFM89_030620, partial [Coptis chinensis]